MIAIELLLATLFSSIVGSLHCIGMCTPFAVLAMGPAGSVKSVRGIRLLSYHLGRLITYLAMGLGVALVSSIARALVGGDGAFPIVGWAVGLTMIWLGTVRLIGTFAWQAPVRHSRWSQRWTAAIIAIRRTYAKGPVWLAALLWGLTSTLLPCGWLYIFVLASAAAPSVLSTLAMMTAFWIGTLPLLSAVAWGWSSLNPRWNLFAQPFAASLIISFGLFILLQRSAVNLESIAMPSASSKFVTHPNGQVDSTMQSSSKHAPVLSALEMVRRALSVTLPCCRGNDVATP